MATWRPSRASRVISWTMRLVNRFVAWHRLPRWLGVLNLYAFRETLRAKNLHDTSQLPNADCPPYDPEAPEARPPQVEWLHTRSSEGKYTDLRCPFMGAKGTRFGRNVPLPEAYPDQGGDLMTPSPRVVSERLLKRNEFVPATTLNLLAAAWIQFMTHDWFDHGKPVKGDEFEVPLGTEPWHENPMRIRRTPPDSTRTDGGRAGPPTFRNFGSHWWDASQIYGNSDEETQKLRCPDGEEEHGRKSDGKLHLNRRKAIPEQELAVLHNRVASMAQQAAPRGAPGKESAQQKELRESFEEELPGSTTLGAVEQAGVVNNWWLGLSILHTVFAKEHNAIVDRLQIAYPDWSGDQLFHTARLINTALMAKIHTVEWTVAILGHPALDIAMNANWWGAVSERITRLMGRISDSEFLSGIPGSELNHHSAPYALTEEFVAVYRLHALMPDRVDFYHIDSGEKEYSSDLENITAGNTLSPIREKGFSRADICYSFGIAHPGAVVLHNFPNWMRNLERIDHDENGKEIRDRIDLAAIDVMRDRERGVPRYNRFRRLLNLAPARSFSDITSNKVWQRELAEVYNNDVEKVDLMVGMYAEDLPKGFGFSDTAFRVFILMASRRLKSDRFFTTDYNANVYTGVGMNWINENNMRSVLLRHYPTLAPVLRQVNNAFAPWPRIGPKPKT